MGHDMLRTGYNPVEHTIGPGSFGTFHQIWSQSVSGEVGEPALATNVNVGGRLTNILYSGTMRGGFYAFNADTGAILWSHQLGTSTNTCAGKSGTFGINAAPVIDRATNRVYTDDGADEVHAFDLVTGIEQSGWPINVSNGNDPNHNFMYGGLNYNAANHLLYATTSGTCDNSPWYGRVVAIDTVFAQIKNFFFPTQGASGGGVWGFGGAAVDPATNDVFIATGNADVAQGHSQNAFYAEQVVSLTSDLNPVIESNLPNIPGNGNDYDFGATPLLFQPPGCPSLLAAVNKSGILVIYNRYNISAGALQNLQISVGSDAGDLIGVPTYDPVTNMLYVGLPSTFGNYKPGMAAFGITGGCILNPNPVWSAQFGGDGSVITTDTPRSPITIANGVAYVSDFVTERTYAFDAATGQQLWTAALNGFGATGPVVANGKLYVGSMGQTMTAWSP